MEKLKESPNAGHSGRSQTEQDTRFGHNRVSRRGRRRGLAGDEQGQTHVLMRQVGLTDDRSVFRVCHIDAGKILRRTFMRDPQYAFALVRHLQGHAFANAAKTTQRVMRN